MPISSSRVLSVGAQKQLFVDDYVIDQMMDIRQVLNPAVKHEANPLLDQDRGDFTQLYGTVLYDPDEKAFRAWYMGRGGVHYALSQDGLQWEIPCLGLVEFEGSKENNIVLNGPYEGLDYCPEMRDIEGPDRVYKCLRYENWTWMPYFSPDGLRWSEAEAPPVVKGGDECKTCKTRDGVSPHPAGLPKYAAFPKLGAKVGQYRRRSVGLSLSEDYVNWSSPVLVMAPDEVDDQTAHIRVAEALEAEVIDLAWPEDYRGEFYHMCVFPYEGLYLGFVDVFYICVERWRIGQLNQGGPDEVQLTSSRDLIHWHRAGGRKPIIDNSVLGDWDAGWRSTTNRPLVIGDEIWIYYGASNTDHGGLVWNDKPRTRGLGLAKLRLDGFVSLDAGETPGTMTTRPLRFQGAKLVINAQAKGGSVAVEILDRDGRSIEGFDAADCDAFSGDSLRHTVTWGTRSDLSALRGAPIRLRFHLNMAKLYSFVFP